MTLEALAKGLSRRTLRAMRDRWQRDLDRLEAAYPFRNWEASEPDLEVIRNLATAIAEIDTVIGKSCSGDPTLRAHLLVQKDHTPS